MPSRTGVEHAGTGWSTPSTSTTHTRHEAAGARALRRRHSVGMRIGPASARPARMVEPSLQPPPRLPSIDDVRHTAPCLPSSDAAAQPQSQRRHRPHSCATSSRLIPSQRSENPACARAPDAPPAPRAPWACGRSEERSAPHLVGQLVVKAQMLVDIARSHLSRRDGADDRRRPGLAVAAHEVYARIPRARRRSSANEAPPVGLHAEPLERRGDDVLPHRDEDDIGGNETLGLVGRDGRGSAALHGPIICGRVTSAAQRPFPSPRCAPEPRA